MALVLSFSWSFRFSWADTVDDVSVPVPDLSQIAEPEYDPNIDYFCVEHLQPLISAEDLEPGQVQVCLGCHPEFLDIQPAIYADNATPLFPSGVAWSKWVDNLVWTNCPTLIGEDQTVLYKLNSRGGGRSGNVLIRLIFSSQVQKKAYFNFSSTSSTVSSNFLSWNQISGVISFPVPSLGAARSSYNLGQLSNGYYPVSLNKWLDGISGNTVYFGFYDDSFSDPLYNASIGSFSFSDEPFGGTVGGPGGGQVTPPEPEPPGWDSPDGWLGGLINSIIEGIRELIDGISNIAGNIAKLPGLIADALRSMLNAIKNAITAIGNQISSAIEALGNFLIEGLKSLFIPSEGYFEGKANEMRIWLEEHLGLLVYPFTLVADLAERVSGLQNGEPVVHVPEIAYIQDTEKYVLIAEQDVNIYDQVNRKQIFLDIHKYYLMAMDAAIAMALVVLAWKKFDQITGGRDT